MAFSGIFLGAHWNACSLKSYSYVRLYISEIKLGPLVCVFIIVVVVTPNGDPKWPTSFTYFILTTTLGGRLTECL